MAEIDPNEPTHYETLGVPETATETDIRRAYRQLAREVHPDRGGDPARAAAVNAAFTVLGSPDSRFLYDADLKQARHAATPAPKAPEPRRANPTPAPAPAGSAATEFDWDAADRQDRRERRAEIAGWIALAVAALLIIAIPIAVYIITNQRIDWSRLPENRRSTSYGALEIYAISTARIVTVVLTILIGLAPTSRAAIKAAIIASATGGMYALIGTGDWTRPFLGDMTLAYGLAPAVIVLALYLLRGIIALALDYGIAPDPDRGRTPAPARTAPSDREPRPRRRGGDRTTRLQAFVDDHPDAAALYLTEPYERAVGAPTLIDVTDLATGRQERRGIWVDYRHSGTAPAVIAVAASGLELGRIDYSDLLAHEQRHGPYRFTPHRPA